MMAGDQTAGRHAEIKRRYAWQAQQRSEKPDQARLITLIRLRELERIFQSRYGRFLPDDDAGVDDLTVAAHHVAFLRGDVVTHIVAWARSWAPWLPQDKAKHLAERVAADPRKFTADALAWRLRLSMAERTALKITTIGAFDVSKAEREEERKRKRREAERARRAKARSGMARGRPGKMRGQQVEDILLATDYPRSSEVAREASENVANICSLPSENLTKSVPAAEPSLSDLKAEPAVPPATTTRAEGQNIWRPDPDREYEAIKRFKERRREWEQKRDERSSIQRFLSPVRELTRDEIWARETEREAQLIRLKEIMSRSRAYRAAS
ncbi:hypothetical protein JQ615_18395 [Bradyrhizobium jicamae]|uniref:Uncharacterized protein n=1 Tax=Bradyrhizobium jicamae TaxID=280332 RepID=A0ABS5FKQ0_9BRAD|nr:hypothetical protein [Bradyrhizobium jicamae]MBR0797361.1 hypothetical protein [Bradyrhizobium jicamae]